MFKKFFTGAVISVAALFILSFSIALPILIRPFYYAHIKPLNLESISGYSYEQITEAYGEVMDYLIGKTDEFSAGEFAFSKSGASHFADVKELFLLDIYVLLITAVLLCAAIAFAKLKKYTFHRFLNRSVGFWSGAVLLGVFLIIALLAAADFSRAFEIFHTVFFPGKTNWGFNYNIDPIILVLPEVFFRNCAILIFGSITVISGTLIIADLKKCGKKSEKC